MPATATISVSAFTHAGDSLDERVSPALGLGRCGGSGVAGSAKAECRTPTTWPSTVRRRPARAEYQPGRPRVGCWRGWLGRGWARTASRTPARPRRRPCLRRPGVRRPRLSLSCRHVGLRRFPRRSLALAEEGIQTADRLGIAATHGSDLRGDAGLLLIDDGRWPQAASVLEPADPRAIPSLARACWRSGAATSPSRTMSSSRPRSGHRSAVVGSVRPAGAGPRRARLDPRRPRGSRPRDRVRAALVDGLGPRLRCMAGALDGSPRRRCRRRTAFPRHRTTCSIRSRAGRRRSQPSSRAATSPDGIAPRTPGQPLAGPTTRAGLGSARPRPGSPRATGDCPTALDERSGSPTPRSRTLRDRAGTSPVGRASSLARPAAFPPTVGADHAGAGSPGAACRGPDQPPDRRDPVPQREDRRDPCVEDPRQVGRRDPRRSRVDRAPVWAARRGRVTTVPAVRP